LAAYLIINADDFGLSHSVNAAVLRAYRDGALTSASLMVTGRAAGEAIRIARENPELAVGLHLALSDSQPARAALRYWFSGKRRAEVKREVEAQFDAFAETGLPLSHVDGHQHLHAHPAVLPTVVDLAGRYGAKGIRVPRDPIWLNLRLDSSALAYKATAALGVVFLTNSCKRRLRGCGLARCDYSIGSLMSGRMNARHAVRVLRELKCDSVELVFHPSIGPERVRFGPNRGDLDALLSAEFKWFLASGNWRLTTYAGLSQSHEEAQREPR